MLDQPKTRWVQWLVRGLLLLLVAMIVGGLGVFSLQETNAQAPAIAAPPPARKMVLDREAFVVSEPDTFLSRPSPLLLAPINEQILTVAFSPDGKKLVTAGAHAGLLGQFKIWDVATTKELVAIKRIAGVRGVAFSPDGQFVATGDFSGTIQLRAADTGATMRVARGHPGGPNRPGGVNSVAFSPDGKSLASAGLDQTVKVWDTTNLQERKTYVGHTDMVFSVAFFPDGQTLVSGGRDLTAKIWDLQTGKEKFTLQGHLAGVEMVAVSPDGKTVATASWDQTVKLWDAETGKEIGSLTANEGAVFAVAFSPVDGNLLASATASGTVRLWDVKAQKSLGKLEKQPLPLLLSSVTGLLGSSSGQGTFLAAISLIAGRPEIHAAAVWTVAFSSDGKYLASGSADKTAKVWDVSAIRETEVAKEVATLNAGSPVSKPIQALAYAPDGFVLGMATDDQTVQLRNAGTGDVLRILKGHTGVVTCLAFSPDGQTIASGSSDKTLKLWNRVTGEERHTLKGHTGGVHALAFTPDGKKLVSAGDDKTIKVWDPMSGQELTILIGHEASIRALALAPDSRTLASGSADQTIKLWDLSKEKEPPLTLKRHRGTVRSVAFSSTGVLASASEDGTVKLWEAAQGKERLTLKGHGSEVWSLAFSPSGRTLVSGGADSLVIVWDTVSGQSRQTLQGHMEEVTALAFEPHGVQLLSGGYDAALRWSGADSTFPILTLQGNPDGTRFSAFSPRNDWLVSGGDGGNVTLWSRSLTSARYPSSIRGGSTWDAAFSPDGRSMAIGSNNSVQIWDAFTRQVLRLFPVKKQVRLLAYSPDGQYLAATLAGSTAPEVHTETVLFNAATGQELAKCEGESDTTFAMRISPDGKTLATTGREKTIQLREIPSGKLRATLREHGVTCSGLVFLPDGTMVTSSWDGAIRFWDVGSGRLLKVWKVGTGLASLDVSPDGTLLAAGEAERPGQMMVKVWEVATGKEKFRFPHDQRIKAVAFTRDGRYLLSTGGALNAFGLTTLWDLSNGQQRIYYRTAGQWMGNIAISRDGKRVVTCSNTLYLWDLDFTHEERIWAAHGREVTCGLLLPDGKSLATGSGDSTIKLWNTGTGELLATLKGHESPIRCLALLPDGKTLLSASEDTTVKLWDLVNFTDKATLRAHTMPVNSLAVSPDGKTLAAGGGDPSKPGPGELILWDLETLKPNKPFAGIDNTVWSIAYSPDGTLLAAGIATGVIKVWDVKPGELRITLATPDVRSLAFSADGKFLAAGQGKSSNLEPEASRVCLWDTSTWQKRAVLQRHFAPIHTVNYSPDGGTLATASQDGTIKLCSLSPARSQTAPAVAVAAKIPIGDLIVTQEPVIAPPPPPKPSSNDPVPPQPATPPPAAPPKPKSLVWIPEAELVGMMLTLAMVISVGVWLQVRHNRAAKLAAEEPILDTAIEEDDEPIIDVAIEEPEAPPPISFRCSACGKGLKAKAELAGKKIKCRQCGKVIPVPATSTDKDGRISL